MRQATLLDCLLANEIDFVLIGGMAAVAHGSVRMTRDLDVCVPLDADNFLRLQDALRPLNPMVRAGAERIPLKLDAESAGRLKNLYFLTDAGNLDCLGDVAGIGDYAAALSQSVTIEIGGRPCRVLSLEALIKAKETLGRPHDLLTAIELRAILERVKSTGRE
jgi:hypothetical protein